MIAVAAATTASWRGNAGMTAGLNTIINVRGVREAWGELLDALLISVHALAGDGEMTSHDRANLVVQALKFWPDHSVTTMVDRVELVERTIAASDGGALALIADRDQRAQTISSLMRPILCITAQRSYDAAETARLGAAVRVAGDDPARFGLAG